MKQKFRKLTFVKIDNLGFHHDEGYISRHHKGATCIVEGTYSQLFGGTNIDDYSLFVVEDGKVRNSVSWTDESLMTALPDEEQNAERAEEMIKKYQREADR